MKVADRKSEWRRDVYMTAIDCVMQAMASVAALPDRPFDDPTALDDLHRALASISKVWLVAESKAALLTRELADGLGEQFLRLATKAEPIRSRMDLVRTLGERLEFLREECLRGERAHIAAREAGQTTERIDISWQRNMELADTVRRQVRQIQGETLGLRKEYFELMNELGAFVQQVVVRLVAALREELSLAPELEAFLQRQEQSHKRATVIVREIFAAAEAGEISGQPADSK